MELAGFHVICTTYGFWLPNDERGSGSDYVRASHLLPFGPANPISTRQSVANKPFDPEIRRLAKESLFFPPVEFTNKQIECVGRGFSNEIAQFGGTIWACAILPTHFHMVIARLRYDIRRFAGRLRGAATKQLKLDGLHPLQAYLDKEGEVPSPWGRLPWVVYLFTEDDVLRSIRYCEDNLRRARMPAQNWEFVTRYRL